MNVIAGEDRSSFQPVAGWGSNAFAFSKATEGISWRDPAFAQNWANARAEGKVRGAYHFFHPADSPAVQAQFFYSTVSAHGLVAGDMLAADVEILAGADSTEDYGTQAAAARAHEGLRAVPVTVPVGAGALAFLQELARLAGPSHRVIVYSDLFMAMNTLGACSAYPLWIAAYSGAPPTVINGWDTWTFWQPGPGGGPGGGDLDYFNGTRAQLQAWASPVLPPDWTYPPVQILAAHPGETSVSLQWDAPAQPPGEPPLPAIGGYDIAAVLGPELRGPDIASYPREAPKLASPQSWQGGSFPRKTQVTIGVRAVDKAGRHAGEWATATVTTT